MKRVMIWLRHGALVIEWLLGILWHPISLLIPRKELKPIVDVYNAVRHPGGVMVFGRVLSEKVLVPPTPEDGKWVNFKRMASQWLTRELPRCEVQLVINGATHREISNKEGYVCWELAGIQADQVLLRLQEYRWEKEVSLHGHGEQPRYVVISDVDDTVMETGAISMGKMVKTTLFGNSLTRELVEGMPELLNELHEGGRQPVFYVTSSPWNLANFLRRVFHRAGLPQGGLFMTDWGLTPEQWISPSHDVHKRAAIDKVAEWFPHSKLILIGDDSQMDPEIYAGALRDYGGKRVSAVMIRSVSGAVRAEKVRADFRELNGEGEQRAKMIYSAREIRLNLQRLQILD